jgi:hypothetical protein
MPRAMAATRSNTGGCVIGIKLPLIDVASRMTFVLTCSFVEVLSRLAYQSFAAALLQPAVKENVWVRERRLKWCLKNLRL